MTENLSLFPLTLAQIRQIPNLFVVEGIQTDTYKSLFVNELLALNTCARRNLAPEHYFKLPNGDTNLDLSSIVLDASSFYLFAHKTLVSSIFILSKTIPSGLAQGIPLKFSTFSSRTASQYSDLYSHLYSVCGCDIAWAQRSIIDKRDNLVQHWQGNISNKFFTMIFAWDLPLLVYYDPRRLQDLNASAIGSLCASVRRTHSGWQLDSSADTLQKIVWLEGWSLRLSSQIQDDINQLTDDSIYISLPITPQLIKRIDKTLSGILTVANQLKPTERA